MRANTPGPKGPLSSGASGGAVRPRALAALFVLTALLARPMTPMTGGARAAAVAGDTELASLVAAERAFSALSVEKGMREAFLANLADDGIMFQPLPVNGKQIWQSRPASPATLIWEPSVAEVSAAGDLGWTTGPWEFRPPADSAGVPPAPDQIAHGHFTTVWQKQPDGVWRVAIDLGISHDKPARGVGSGDLVSLPSHTWISGPGPVKKPTDLAALDRRFAEDLRKADTKMIPNWMARDVRVNREGAPPSTGVEAAQAVYGRDPRLLELAVMGSRVSASDDLGCTYGVIARATESGAPDSSAYFHVWRKEADRKWRLASSVENPVRRR